MISEDHLTDGVDADVSTSSISFSISIRSLFVAWRRSGVPHVTLLRVKLKYFLIESGPITALLRLNTPVSSGLTSSMCLGRGPCFCF